MDDVDSFRCRVAAAPRGIGTDPELDFNSIQNYFKSDGHFSVYITVGLVYRLLSCMMYIVPI